MLLVITGVAKAQQLWKYQTGVEEDLYNICCVDDNMVFACGENGVILKSINGGINWEEKHRRTGCKMTEICFVDSNNGYAVCDSSLNYYAHQWFLVKTCDGGETWNEVGNPIFSWIECFTSSSRFVRTEMFLINSDNLVVAVSADGIYKSTDGGLTMQKLTIDFTINETRGIFFEDNVGYLLWNDEEDFVFPGERHPGVAKTEDYGETWSLIENISDITDDMAYARFYDKDHIRLFGSFRISEYDYKGMLETYDGFDTFESFGQSSYYHFSEVYIRAKFTENGQGMNMIWEYDMPGVGRGVSYTENDGLTWTNYSGYSLPSYRFYDIDGIDTTFFISCEGGMVLKNRQFTLMGTDENSYEASVYPNPASNVIEICGKNMNIVELYSALGICLIKNQGVNADKIILDIHDFADGVYYVRIADGENHIKTLKLVKQR